MRKPRVCFAATPDGLRAQLRGYLNDAESAIRGGRPVSDFIVTGPPPSVRKTYFFSREAMRIVHHFLGGVVSVPEGGFAPTVARIRTQLHVMLSEFKRMAEAGTQL